jgi:co-chaperonin GroES (HSP10)
VTDQGTASPIDWEGEWEWVETCRRLAESLVPVPIEPWVWKRSMWGKRILVRKVPKDTRIGQIIIPEKAQVPHKAGWVLIVGPEISYQDPARFPNVCPWPNPLELVGRPIYWSPFSGADIFPHDARRFDETDYAIITVGDIMGCEVEHQLPEEKDE